MSTSTLLSTSIITFGAPTKIPTTQVNCPSPLGMAKSVPDVLGLRVRAPSFKVSVSAVYKVKLISPDGAENEFQAPEDDYILDSAEVAGIELPYSCKAGACSTCAAKMVSGSVDQSDGTSLDEQQLGEGYLLTCIAYPTSDCVIHTHKEADLS